MTRRTSAIAYNTIKENGILSKRRWQVYDVLFNNGPLTANQMINLFTQQYKHYHLTNTGSLATRLSEMRHMGAVYEVDEIDCPISSHKVILWDVTDAIPTKLKRPKSIKFREILRAVYKKYPLTRNFIKEELNK